LVEVSTSLDLGARLARLLLEAERRETRSQSELARIASASRESVNRKLSQWRAVGWVDIGPSGIAVLDRAALRREAKLDE
jgi:CRP-like cAMP-binding protein